MKGYLDFLCETADDLILPRDRYGDHSTPHRGGSYTRGDPEMSSSWYLLYNAMLLASSANLLGYEEDAKQYEKLADDARAAIHQRFYNPGKETYDDGSQCAMIMALYLDVPPDSEIYKKVEANLLKSINVVCQGRLGVGILGTRYAMELLTRLGHLNTAWHLATSTDYPSWGYMTKGRTTLSEQWNQYFGSNNHVMFGSVDTWFYETLAGINVDLSQNEEKLWLAPWFEADLEHCRAAREIPQGRILSEWRREDGEMEWRVELPHNTRATLRIPNGPRLAEADNVIWDGAPQNPASGIGDIRLVDDSLEIKIGSGNYRFTWPQTKKQSGVE